MTTKLHKAYSKNKKAYFYYKCKCENIFISRGDNNPKSCGCLIGKPKSADTETNTNKQLITVPKEHKKCYMCKNILHIDSFHRGCNRCKECSKIYKATNKHKWIDKTREYSFQYKLKQLGLTEEQYNELKESRLNRIKENREKALRRKQEAEELRQQLELKKISPTKECIKCGDIKPKSEFFKAKGKIDGYDNRCKECEKLRLRRERNMQPKVHRTPEEIKIRKKLQKHKRRFREQQGKIKPNEIRELKIKQNNRCYWCNTSIAKTYQIDHYYPLSKGGEHLIDNIVLACPHCNMSKHDKDPLEYANKIGRLL